MVCDELGQPLQLKADAETRRSITTCVSIWFEAGLFLELLDPEVSATACNRRWTLYSGSSGINPTTNATTQGAAAEAAATAAGGCHGVTAAIEGSALQEADVEVEVILRRGMLQVRQKGRH